MRENHSPLVRCVTLCGCCVVWFWCVRAEPGTFFHNFLTRTKAMTPDERAVALEEDEAVRFRVSLVVSGQSCTHHRCFRMDVHGYSSA